MGRSPGLKIPAQRKPGRQDFSLRPKKVDVWLDNLPQANLGETGRLIYHTLTQTNRLQYPFTDRFRFLEQMREPVHYVTDSMRKHFLAMTFPLPEKNRRIAVATQEIYAAMATGYKIAIEEMTRSHPLFQDKKLLASLLLRALTYTGHSLLTAYQIYAPTAPRSWQELHKLYAYAESRRLHKTVVKDEQRLVTDKTTLQAEYLRLLLLALASPYQLRQGEILRVYHALERWARRLELRPLSVQPTGDTKTRFLVRLDKDAPPRPAAYSIIRETHWSRYRQLDTEILTHLLQKEIRSNEDVIATTLSSVDLGSPDLSHDLMRRLLVAWGAETKRNFPRSPKHESVEVTIGLNATHRFLNQLAHRQDGPDLFEHRSHYESQDIKSINEVQHDVWDMIYTTDATTFDTHGIMPLFDAELARHDASAPGDEEEFAASDPAQPYRAGSWLILNESASGYCLEYHEAATTQAQVGEVVGIRRSLGNKTLKWGIGVIRWLKFAGIQAEEQSGKTVQMGIEMLNPAAAAVGIRPAAVSNHPENYQRTLLLPEIRAMHQPATLITNPLPWRPGQHAVLNIHGKELPVVLTLALQNTGLFAQFEFQSTAPDWSRDSAPHQDDALSEVWSSI